MSTEAFPFVISKAIYWVQLFDRHIKTKFSIINDKNRDEFWQFLMTCIGRVGPDFDPVTQLVMVAGVAVKANCGILPPYAYSKMMLEIGEDLDLAVDGFDAWFDSTEGGYAEDTLIPQAIALSIARLPAISSDYGGVLPLSGTARDYLIAHVYKKLKFENDCISKWVHGSDGELDYWENDFNDLAEELATKLDLTSEERTRIEEELTIERNDRGYSREASLLNLFCKLESDNIDMDFLFRR